MLARQSGNVGDLLDDELRRFNATVLVNIEAVGQLYDATVGRAGLVECNRVHGVSARCRPHAKLEMIFTNRTLFVDLEISGEHGFGKPGTPGPCFPQHFRKLQLRANRRR